ncbi:Cyclin-D-binding Myb-like transcription factor 1, partial [Spiromyces aspiralis]
TGAAGPRSSVLRIVARTSGNKPNPWTQEETQRLIEAVTDLYWEKNKQPPNTQQAWEAIARQVPTQSNSRCRQRWYSWLYDVFHPDVGKVTWEFKDEAELIDRIRNSGAIESNSIDWQAVAGTDWTWHTPDICRVHWERRVLMHPIASAFDVEKQLDWLSDQILEQKSASKTPHDWFKHYYYGMDTEEVNKVREAVFKEIIQRNKDVHEATPEQWAQVSRRCKSFPNICRVLWDAWVHCRYIDADGVR